MTRKFISFSMYIAAPVITAMPASSPVNITTGFSLTLTCTSSGSPPDTFTWMKDGIPISQPTNTTIVHYNSTVAVFSTNYIVNNVSISDGGTYTCIVANPIGSDNHTFTVNICKLSKCYE